MNVFEYELGAQVTISVSNESGTIIARAQHSNTDNQYLLRYMAGDGRAVEAWWDVAALTPYRLMGD